MAIEITIPRLGWNMDEGVFAGWLKIDGEHVRAGDRIFTLESEKATEEIESLDEGVLQIATGGPNAGDTIAVGAVIGYLVRAGELGTATEANPLPQEKLAARRPGEGTRPGSEAEPQELSPGPSDHPLPRERVQEPQAGRETAGSRPVGSPRARRVAQELGIDWARLSGSGRSGRVRERDVRAAAHASPQTTSGDSRIPVTPIRKAIADRMVTSLSTTAPVTLTTTADATNLVNLREQFRAVAHAGPAIIPGYTDFFLKLTAAALEHHPLLNARWEGTEIIVSRSIHMGIAVDTNAGLLVPVVRDVPGLSLRQVTERARDLVERARGGSLRAQEMEGGTFTVTSLGAFGVDAFTPIINIPQCAVLGVGRIQRRAVAVGDQVTIRDQVVLSLTFDHRIVDGAPAARFLQTLSSIIENPSPWLLA